MKAAARQSKHALNFILAMSFCAATFSSGCGSKGTAAPPKGGENPATSSAAEPPEISLEQQTEQKLDPLTKEDVELYLKVMRAAAERVKTPALGDTAALDGARRILAASPSGRVPTHDDVMTLERANLVAISMDQIVAEEMKLDGRTYRGVAEAIEADVSNPALGVAAADTNAPAADHTPTPIEKRLSAVNATNEKFLAPYRDEIQKLISIVRNPANLPK